jgi:hypothetical protein
MKKPTGNFADALKEAKARNESMRAFIRYVINEAFSGQMMPDEIISDAELRGFLVNVPYDPEKHGTDGVAWFYTAGDPWFVLADWLDDAR